MKLSRIARWSCSTVAPFTGAWIETGARRGADQDHPVAPFTGAWIETPDTTAPRRSAGESLPSRERGLKLYLSSGYRGEKLSLPSRERGLKLAALYRLGHYLGVAPFTGAWIETKAISPCSYSFLSLPSRERGLKQAALQRPAATPRVAPFTGAWIETSSSCFCRRQYGGRSLHGSVD